MSPLIKYRAYEINGIKILRAEKLEKLEQMKSEKSELWTALKLMLHLS